MLAPWKESYDKPRQHIKKQRHHFDDKDPSSQRASQVAQLINNPPAIWGMEPEFQPWVENVPEEGNSHSLQYSGLENSLDGIVHGVAKSPKQLKDFHLVKAMIFPVVRYRCKTCTIKKAECQKMVAFKLWCWKRFLRVPWTARRSNQSILRKTTLNVHWKDWWWSWNSNT